MNYETILARSEHLKELIRTESTGTPRQLSQKLGTSVSTIYRMIKALKNMGEPILYSKIRETYYFDKN